MIYSTQGLCWDRKARFNIQKVGRGDLLLEGGLRGRDDISLRVLSTGVAIGHMLGCSCRMRLGSPCLRATGHLHFMFRRLRVGDDLSCGWIVVMNMKSRRRCEWPVVHQFLRLRRWDDTRVVAVVVRRGMNVKDRRADSRVWR